MSRARWSPFLLAAVWLVVLCRGDEAPEPTAHRLVPAEKPSGSEFRGSGSCSATACHGSIVPRDLSLSAVLGNEHTTWLSDDAHSRAYQVLFEPRSDRIVCNLALDRTRVKPAHQDERCLACHTTPRPASELTTTQWMNSDGVGCESCHGRSGHGSVVIRRSGGGTGPGPRRWRSAWSTRRISCIEPGSAPAATSAPAPPRGCPSAT